ncbi:unnamed protein product [Dibothriocephalus latus]|uniref:CSN8/PSMD8/EIF3K domain-containing protein n=1 Tax=Dibothriocephalus latus TaxID=60516 RepID=A0A3P7LHR6_DIBLA|nr:unnamed protein product [Dibothriocephalus latus]
MKSSNVAFASELDPLRHCIPNWFKWLTLIDSPCFRAIEKRGENDGALKFQPVRQSSKRLDIFKDFEDHFVDLERCAEDNVALEQHIRELEAFELTMDPNNYSPAGDLATPGDLRAYILNLVCSAFSTISLTKLSDLLRSSPEESAGLLTAQGWSPSPNGLFLHAPESALSAAAAKPDSTFSNAELMSRLTEFMCFMENH